MYIRELLEPSLINRALILKYPTLTSPFDRTRATKKTNMERLLTRNHPGEELVIIFDLRRRLTKLQHRAGCEEHDSLICVCQKSRQSIGNELEDCLAKGSSGDEESFEE